MWCILADASGSKFCRHDNSCAGNALKTDVTVRVVKNTLLRKAMERLKKRLQ